VENDTGSRVYILGAGCSYDEHNGYPLAKQFTAELSSFAERISQDGECLRIKSAVDATVALLHHCRSGSSHASTIDQLINLVLKGECDGQLARLGIRSAQGNIGLRNEGVRNAKIATAACFLAKEPAVLQHQIDKYKNFISRKVLDETGTSSSSQVRLMKSSARVLSFNYDRLFELAFFAGFTDQSVRQSYPYSDVVLNSGLTAFGEGMTIQKDRFCFLKLHGSVGMLCTEDEFGEKVYWVGDGANGTTPKVTDKLFFQENQSRRFSIEPMIVFPYEKDYIVSGRNNRLPFRTYIERTWAHAAHVLQEASDIWIIGYSFDPTDCRSLIELMRKAAKCTRIVIQNLPDECDRIAALLRTDYKINIPIEPYPIRF
jgi:hypothetical protein